LYNGRKRGASNGGGAGAFASAAYCRKQGPAAFPEGIVTIVAVCDIATAVGYWLWRCSRDTLSGQDGTAALRVMGETMAKAKAKAKATGTVYQLKITLAQVRPPIWRRLEVQDCSLAQLHAIIQVAMGWGFSHLWAFEIDGEQYGEDSAGMEDMMSARVKLSRLADEGVQKFGYTYDFGDSWDHIVRIEKVREADPKVKYPRCVAGKRACPPEDCGGVWGYGNFLEAISDPGHAEHDELLEWVGGEFDPEAFDPTEINKRLAATGSR
jgi:hypothetical protein